MTIESRFQQAFPYQDDILALPVKDVGTAARWYSESFGLTEVSRQESPVRTVLMERDSVRIGFAENGGDSSQDGAAILVRDIEAVRNELAANGVQVGDSRIDERDGQKLRVFFVVAPDGLCYYFHEPISG